MHIRYSYAPPMAFLGPTAGRRSNVFRHVPGCWNVSSKKNKRITAKNEEFICRSECSRES